MDAQDKETPDEYPLLSAIMLAGRVQLEDILACIQCFNDQTYPYKELIIVNNTKTQYEASNLEIQAQSNIFILDTPSSLTAGMARNYGISASNGQILAQFDPDYWHAPSRLAAQVATMANEKAHICILASALKYSFVSGRASTYQNLKNALLGTMVFSRPAKIDYPDFEHYEEFGILHKMLQNNMRPIAMEKPELCCKLVLTNGKRQREPTNYNLTDEEFEIIKQIVDSRVIPSSV
jgi:glycosyltransferase involved in cell wall biosynthesis